MYSLETLGDSLTVLGMKNSFRILNSTEFFSNY